MLEALEASYIIMEKIPKAKPERGENLQVIMRHATSLVRDIPQSQSKERLEADLAKAIEAAKMRNSRAMEDAFASAIERRNDLAKKGFDILEPLEALINQIRDFARKEA